MAVQPAPALLPQVLPAGLPSCTPRRVPCLLPAYPPADIAGLSWSRASRGGVLHVKRSEGPPLSFLGFRDKDVEALRSITARQIADNPLATRCGGAWLAPLGQGQLQRS